jgi:hypothetical protein
VSSLIASVTAEPEFTSVALELATATGNALGDLASLVLAPPSAATDAEAQLSSVIAEFPEDVQSFFSSFTAAEGSIISSVLDSVSYSPTYTPAAETASSSATNVGGLHTAYVATALGVGAALYILVL